MHQPTLKKLFFSKKNLKKLQCLTIVYVQAEYSLRTFTGHQASIMSLDFHPNKQDVICSCDSAGQVRSWSTIYSNCLNCVKVSRVCRIVEITLTFHGSSA